MSSVAFRLWAASSASTGTEDGTGGRGQGIEAMSAVEAQFETTLANTRNRYSATECVPVSDEDLESLRKVKAAAYGAYKYTWREYFVRFRACTGKEAFDYEPSVKVKNAGVWNTFIAEWTSHRSKRMRARRDALLSAVAAVLSEGTFYLVYRCLRLRRL